MAKKRTTYTGKMKLQVVIEMLSKNKTQAEITSEYWVWPTQQAKWRKQLLEEGASIFEDKRKKASIEADKQKEIDRLHQKIGQLSVERDWLEKKLESSLSYYQRLNLVEWGIVSLINLISRDY